MSPAPAETPEGSRTEEQAELGLAPDASGGIDLGDLRDLAQADLGQMLTLASVVVEAASRRSQSIHEAPASIRVTTAKQIETLGTWNVAEALALTPGLEQLRSSNIGHDIGLRGFNVPVNNRVLVVMDGRSHAIGFQEYPVWNNLALHALDLSRIEVVRGPGSTLYGANALSGVIVLKGKRPLAHPGFEGAAAAGLLYLPELDDAVRWRAPMTHQGVAYLAHGWVREDEKLGMRLSVLTGHEDRWEAPEFDPSGRHGDFRYGLRLALDHVPARDWLLEADLTHMAAETPGAQGVQENSTYVEQTLRATLARAALWSKRGRLRVHLDARRLRQRLAQREVSNNRAHTLVTLDMALLQDRLLLTGGVDATLERTYDLIDQQLDKLYVAAIGEAELALTADRSWLLGAGLRAERIDTSYQDQDLRYENLTPRGSLIWRFDARHDLRLALATAIRAPSPFQSLLGVQLESEGEEAPPVAIIQGNVGLQPEQVRSVELGYRGEFGEQLFLEGNLFAQQLRGLIVTLPSADRPLFYRNALDLEQIGLETQLDLRPTPWLTAGLGYTLTRNLDAQLVDGSEPGEDFPGHLVNASLDATFLGEFRVHADAQLASRARRIDYLGDPALPDTRALRPFRATVNLRLGRLLLDDRFEVSVAARNLLGFVRAEDQILQAPGGDPIGATVLLGLTLRGNGGSP